MAERKRYLIEVIFGPCGEEQAEAIACDLQEVIDERWPEVGAAVGLRPSVESAVIANG
jgi:hypothetical protein